jgi:hypothetical protein
MAYRGPSGTEIGIWGIAAIVFAAALFSWWLIPVS